MCVIMPLLRGPAADTKGKQKHLAVPSARLCLPGGEAGGAWLGLMHHSLSLSEGRGGRRRLAPDAEPAAAHPWSLGRRSKETSSQVFSASGWETRPRDRSCFSWSLQELLNLPKKEEKKTGGGGGISLAKPLEIPSLRPLCLLRCSGWLCLGHASLHAKFTDILPSLECEKHIPRTHITHF